MTPKLILLAYRALQGRSRLSQVYKTPAYAERLPAAVEDELVLRVPLDITVWRTRWWWRLVASLVVRPASTLTYLFHS